MVEKFLSHKFIIILSLMYSFVFAIGTAYFVPVTIVTEEYVEGELAYYGYPIAFIGQEIPENTENTETFKVKANMDGSLYTEVYVSAFLLCYLLWLIGFVVTLYTIRYIYKKGKTRRNILR